MMKKSFCVILAVVFELTSPVHCSVTCTATMDDPLPSCLTKYFLDSSYTLMMDGNGNTCTERSQTISAKVSNTTKLFSLATTMFTVTPTPFVNDTMAEGNCETSTARLQSVVAVKDYGTYKIIVSNGIPTHCYQNGADESNSNLACEHYRAIKISKSPSSSGTYTANSMGIVGIALSGALFFDHKSGESTCNFAGVEEKPTFDTCDGHADIYGRYHYHKAPACISGYSSCGLMGYMIDGIPAYGKCTLKIAGASVTMTTCYVRTTGKNGCDTSHYSYNSTAYTAGTCNLDQANGYTIPSSGATSSDGSVSFTGGSYAYFFTPAYPFIMPGYYGATRNLVSLNVS